MDLSKILSELRSEKTRVEQAIALLEQLQGQQLQGQQLQGQQVEEHGPTAQHRSRPGRKSMGAESEVAPQPVDSKYSK